ncbi:GH36-type glycosyl hydrolase domain-containing protein [Xanthomonas hortorum pv. vitians]|uniref:Cyclic beta-(1,2)-glucan synthase NdvB n=2 Tax=Xanthomonas hortorum pv. vitians TaxID=83224 RepID=A0A6V7BYY9_9XANT|nr:cyclic beta 1-2 glucan synthetase [Xanthomonas hortorum pv. gardneri]NMI30727.1 cyclic beta 1-2 glucan synthetase [Xanthomonas hortorum pv. vitians]NMI39969.1 cyclic beta 1-2 glucan synthetase [Xanthomonas hortorum pv. vitians]NMI43163.1 cyclic beta 1-2 glucan synthetase [Xanthomonas hortorum pv. vitians]CAD0306149.1 Cyclic beta-(1,2)-glucan synthase NdvB [Xanthomonas hortorum pv. vitians]
MPPQRKASAFSLWWQSITQPAATLQHPSVRDAVPEGAALFGDEQMEALGHSLAQAHVLYTGPTRELLLSQLKFNERALGTAAARLTEMSADGLRLHPAGEWLLDNYYLVEEQMRLARQHLPPGYSRQLPRLRTLTSVGLPRVYELGLEVVAHGDGRVDTITLSRFIAAYQQVAPLKLGELWAIPIMLRLALIDNLRRIAEDIMHDGRDTRLAAHWAALLNATAAAQPKDVVVVVADMARSKPPATGAFVAELTRGIQGRGPVLSMASAWVEQWLASEGHSVEGLVHAESQRQAAEQVAISNSIGSLRFLDEMDWRDFVEAMSVVEQTLRKDPADVYARMDFHTRDSYRHVVEHLAQRLDRDEPAVAECVLRLAAQPGSDAPVASHVGYYLVDTGLPLLRSALRDPAAPGTPKPPRPRARRVALPVYLLPIAVIAVLWSGVLLQGVSALPPALWWITAGIALLAASELGIALVNWVATLWVRPHPLPRMDLSLGIPPDCRTLVVMPSMLASPEAIDELVDALEVHYLANRDEQLYFALLTDFLDAAQALLPGDMALVAHAAQHIDRLNAAYADAHGDRFFLLHRARQWNAGEGCWMGAERKRGKLEALNRLLCAGDAPLQAAHEFLQVQGDVAALVQVRYVITLDSDTHLPRDAARALVGAMSHPLNVPRMDAAGQIVEAGYGILQPGLGTGMSEGGESRFARMFGIEPGIDPYTRVVSDVYQDLFGEGSFIGKGIYAVATFEQVLAGRFPDNRVLSHDLLEGCYVRAGLLSDVRLYERHPQRYATDAKRRARWVRGDWQLLPWLLPWVPDQGGRRARNPLSWLSRGKLLDNLRRSLVAPAAFALLLIGWLCSPTPLRWTLWMLVLWLLPGLCSAVYALAHPPEGLGLRHHARQVGVGLRQHLLRTGVVLACLPFEAGLQLAAIARTLVRMTITQRHLLQWAPSSEVERSARSGNAEQQLMAGAACSAALVIAAVAWWSPLALWTALPLGLAWMGAPWLMAWLGEQPAAPVAQLSQEQRDFLGGLSRRTWAFFESHCTAQHHWLPPDNVQEYPVTVVANRTSPTNIGLGLLANLAAYDLGYLTVAGVMSRVANTLTTLEALPRYRGHFYNWYDTETLVPLVPRYVSTVDSGNLVGHLLTLRQGLLALVDAPAVSMAVFDGLADTLSVLTLQAQPRSDAATAALSAMTHSVQTIRNQPTPTLHQADEALRLLLAQSQLILASMPNGGEDEEPWAQRLVSSCKAALAELGHCAPALASTDPHAAQTPGAAVATLRQLANGSHAPSVQTWAAKRVLELQRLAHIAGQLAQMDYDFLYSPAQQLLSIGYNVDDHRLDSGRYDLLASEARLGIFVAIAQGKLPQESWFALGRTLTDTGAEPTLLSWSGSMFEYLMPDLVMPSYPQTLLSRSMRGAVQAQIRYGAARAVPWGVSESGYNTVDTRRNYQYRAFGVPGLGLKRGLGQDLVIAPYASAMALMVEPDAACRNLQQLQALGFDGRFGLYEAIDYTPSRVPRGEQHALVRSFMSHHQGMALLALDHVLRDAPMQKRFVADPQFQATLLLLQERAPRAGVYVKGLVEAAERPVATEAGMALRIHRDPNLPQPALQLLSNGRYHGMLTSAGGGYSRARDMAVTRWREDGTRDHWGTFCYLRDVDSGAVWSAAHQPTCVPVERYEAIFSDAKAEFKGSHQRYDSHLEIAISAEDDVELRRLRIRNRSRQTRVIEITTYAEVVLAPAQADEAHPAFSNLFVQTEILADKQALLCTRRPRGHDEAQPWMLHLVAVHDADVATISYETDRAAFVGRGRSTRNPLALRDQASLSGAAGSVLDPIVAIRCRISLAPDQQAQVDMVYGVGTQRAACTALIDKYRDRRLADRVFDLALTQSQVTRRQINASLEDAMLYERLAARVLFVDPQLRADNEVLLHNHRGQSALWSHAISGDLPIVLLRITDPDNLDLVRQLVQAHAYWRLKGLRADLVIWNESQAGYRQQLQDAILGLIAADPEANVLDRPGGIFVRAIEHISQEDRVLLQTVARAILSDANGTLDAQLQRHPSARAQPPLLEPMRQPDSADELASTHAAYLDKTLQAAAEEPVLFDNGLGAFAADGREYRITLDEGIATPAPWCNVMANAQFGSVVSDSSPGYSWAENAHEFRLTPWHNDPVGDASSEAFYLRDEDTGQVWSPMALPCRGSGRYTVRHGFGYSVYSHIEHGIGSELWVFVDVERPIKFSHLRLKNLSGRPRRLSVTGYVEWVLGDIRTRSQLHVVSEVDLGSSVLTARNPYNTEFDGRVAFFDADAPNRSITADRNEFLGRNGSLAAPAALTRQRLSGRVGAGLDPCAAIQIPVTLAAEQSFETVFRLGAAVDRESALTLARQSRGVAAAHTALLAVRAHWQQILGTVQVTTPDPAVDLLANGWLLYQTIACRFLARSGYYQSGGAYGFRDQLQDSMAMVHAQPALTRAHLLRCAAHQFVQGDVQHWWHPPQDRGVRTQCSDDFLWLPQALCRYLDVTNDASVLDERVSFIDGRALKPEEESYYDLPHITGNVQSLYAHGVLALQRGMARLGERGLPLIGSGDWNDGMNRVGKDGKGESVWLGFFLYDTLLRFADVAVQRDDGAFAATCRAHAHALRTALEQHAWDGRWYRRAWFDDGTPLGSSDSDECRIDSLSQSWAVLSGAMDPARSAQAMEAMRQQLVDAETGIVKLLVPPFDHTEHDPGYIRGYVPGVRENGGQYTHAAVWATMAFAHLGDSARAWQLASMINPIHHARDAAGVQRYKAEPYVLAADVYAVAPHAGRGGWSWYTGAAGWMYRLLTESLLGLQRHGERMHIVPCIPASWPEYQLRYRFGSSTYVIDVTQRPGVEARLEIDGVMQAELAFTLIDDGAVHAVALDWPGDAT